MRVIAGALRGRPLATPAGATTRPTADRTREALFSMLTSRVGSFEGLRVLDLFAGSGALGIEALSRGAVHATFVDQDRGAVDAIRANLDRMALRHADVRAASVMALGPAVQSYDLVLADPPYDTGAGVVALERLHRLGWVASGALVSLETAKGEEPRPSGFEVEASRVHGKARITLLRPAE